MNADRGILVPGTMRQFDEGQEADVVKASKKVLKKEVSESCLHGGVSSSTYVLIVVFGPHFRTGLICKEVASAPGSH